ncbi:MAG: hypothetical protein J5940_07030 [Clostridia bacterium]|nr:hypothetical protein [Clostridia bacterium]
MRRITERVKSGYHLAFLLIFTVFFAWATRYTALFGDDFYYASFVSSGGKYFLSENIYHYLNTNGRAWVHLLDELLLAPKSVWAFGIFNTAVAALTAAAVGKAAVPEGDGIAFRRTLTAACVLLSFVGIQNAYQSVFWATGAMNYFLPVLLSILYFLSLHGRGKLRAAAPALAFFASSSSEQAAFFALCAAAFRGAIYIKERKRPDAVYILSAVLSAIGFAVLFAAPGNAVRTGYYPEFYAMSLFGRIGFNLPILRDLVFSKSGMGDVLTAFFVSEAVSAAILKKPGRIPLFVLSVCGAATYYGYIHLGFPHYFVHAAAAFTAAVTALDIFLSLRAERYCRAFIIFTAAVLQLAMLISPEMGPRTVLCSCILLMIPTAESASEAIGTRPAVSLPVFCLMTFAVTLPGIITASAVCAAVIAAVVLSLNKRTAAYSLFALLMILAVLTADRGYTFVCGYRENYPVHLKNAESVEEYKESGGDTLTLYYLKDPDFKYIMPYENGYHEYWFKRCYGIDENAKIVYKDFE